MSIEKSPVSNHKRSLFLQMFKYFYLKEMSKYLYLKEVEPLSLIKEYFSWKPCRTFYGFWDIDLGLSYLAITLWCFAKSRFLSGLEYIGLWRLKLCLFLSFFSLLLFSFPGLPTSQQWLRFWTPLQERTKRCLLDGWRKPTNMAMYVTEYDIRNYLYLSQLATINPEYSVRTKFLYTGDLRPFVHMKFPNSHCVCIDRYWLVKVMKVFIAAVNIVPVCTWSGPRFKCE